MDFSLTAEQREIQALAREFAEAEIVPHAAAWDREHRFPRDALRQARRARADGSLRTGGATAVRAPTSSRTCSCSRSSRARTQAWGSPLRCTRARRRCRSSPSVPTSSAQVRASARARRDDRCVRAHRARLRLGRRLAAHGGRAGRRRLAAHRLEAVVHEREPRRHVPSLRAHRPVHRRAPAESRPSCSTASTSR